MFELADETTRRAVEGDLAALVRSGTIENLDPGDPELVYFKPVSREDDG